MLIVNMELSERKFFVAWQRIGGKFFLNNEPKRMSAEIKRRNKGVWNK
jgi:hypothetical protein